MPTYKATVYGRAREKHGLIDPHRRTYVIEAANRASAEEEAFVRAYESNMEQIVVLVKQEAPIELQDAPPPSRHLWGVQVNVSKRAEPEWCWIKPTPQGAHPYGWEREEDAARWCDTFERGGMRPGQGLYRVWPHELGRQATLMASRPDVRKRSRTG